MRVNVNYRESDIFERLLIGDRSSWQFDNGKGGPEADLVSSFLRFGLPSSLSRSAPIFLCEPDVGTGYPDLVAVHPRWSASTHVDLIKNGLSVKHFRLLHHVYLSRGISPTQLANDLLISRREVISLVGDLCSCGFTRWQENAVRALPLSKIFAARRILAIEAKIADWSRAIKQANANRWFASESYILIPPLSNVMEVVRRASNFGVGVLVHDGHSVSLAARSKKWRLPSSVGSWVINDHILRYLNTSKAHTSDA